MLNFGRWDNGANPVAAQQKLCSSVGDLADLHAAKRMIDLGSGLGAPARYWISRYDRLNIICVNINRQAAQRVPCGERAPKALMRKRDFGDSAVL